MELPGAFALRREGATDVGLAERNAVWTFTRSAVSKRDAHLVAIKRSQRSCFALEIDSFFIHNDSSTCPCVINADTLAI